MECIGGSTMNKVLTITVILLFFTVAGLLGYQYMQSSFAPSLSMAKETEGSNETPTVETGTMDETLRTKLLKEIPVKKLEEQTVQYEELMTNLQGNNSFVVLQISAIADSKKSSEEAKKREFQLRNFINLEISMMTKEQMSDSQQIDNLLQKAEAYLNEQMTSGLVIQLFLTKKIVQ